MGRGQACNAYLLLIMIMKNLMLLTICSWFEFLLLKYSVSKATTGQSFVYNGDKKKTDEPNRNV